LLVFRVGLNLTYFNFNNFVNLPISINKNRILNINFLTKKVIFYKLLRRYYLRSIFFDEVIYGSTFNLNIKLNNLFSLTENKFFKININNSNLVHTDVKTLKLFSHILPRATATD